MQKIQLDHTAHMRSVVIKDAKNLLLEHSNYQLKQVLYCKYVKRTLTTFKY